MVRLWWHWSNCQDHHSIKTANSALFTQYLLNRLLDFDQPFSDKMLGGWKESIKFDDLDLNFKAHVSTLDLLDLEKIGLPHFIF